MPPTNIACPSSTTTFKMTNKSLDLAGRSHLEVVHLTVVATEPGDGVRQGAVHIVDAHLGWRKIFSLLREVLTFGV